jgi:predicted secreted Zn-dependent protease
LQSLPGTTVQYYDVPGRNGPAIEKNLKRILAQPAPNNTAAQVYNWNLGMSINRRTEGTVCTVTKATAELKANVYLPRLTEEARVPAEELASFKSWASGLETQAAQNLGFVVAFRRSSRLSLASRATRQATCGPLRLMT